MQKKTAETKKVKQTTPMTQTAPTTEEKKKNYSKSLSFFAIFIACIGAAALYPYLTEESEPYVPPVRLDPEPDIFRPIEPIAVPVVQEVKEEVIQPLDCSSQEQTILSQKKTLDELNEKIHQLELENLSLKEKTSSSEKNNALTVQLMKEIYTGHSFKTTLDTMLKEDKSDSFALVVQENLGPYAANGIATPQGLKSIFYAQIKVVQNSLYTNQKGASWNQKCMNFFKSLVHIYPQDIGNAEATADNLLFLIRQQVDAGQFEQALNTIEELPDSSKQLLAIFVQNAQRYIELQKVIEGYLQK